MGATEANGSRRLDAIIVGAGPAGSVTALLLARAGAAVLLLDRATFPRPKPCGDCLSAAATDLLQRLGLVDAVRRAGASEIDHWRIISPDGTAASGRLAGTRALSLERRHLDPVLVNAATAAGAELLQASVDALIFRQDRVVGVRARVAGERRSFRAPLVVGADGLRSVVARRLGLIRRKPRLRKVSLTAHLPAPPGLLHHGEMHVVPDGCVGLAPAGPGVCNVTAVVTTAAAGALRELGPAAFLRRQVLRAPRLADRLDAGAFDAMAPDEPLASGPFDWPTRSPVGHGAALVGDAAGYYDPFTGQGIYQAMAGAERLAEAVAPALPGSGGRSRSDGAGLDRALGEYARSKHRLTTPARRVQHVVEWALSRPRRANRALGILAAAPTAMDRVVEVTGDLRAPHSLLSPAVVSSLLIPPYWRSD